MASPAISRSRVVLPAPDGPNTTPISRPRRKADVERQTGMDPADHVDIQSLGKWFAQRESPRAGRVRCTIRSATIETKEIHSVSQPARAESLTCTAS